MRSKRFRMYLLLVFAAVVLALVLAAIFENRRGARHLRSVIERFKNDRIELDLQKVLARRIPDEENAAIALIQLPDDLKRFTLGEDIAPPPAMRMVAPGFATSFVRELGWPGASAEMYSWVDLRSARSEAERHLPALIAVAQHPRFASPVNASNGLPDVELKALAPLPAVSRILRTITLADLHFGYADGKRAVQSVTTLLNLFVTKSEDPFTIAEIVRTSLSRTAFALTWELLEHAEVNDDAWEPLQNAWEKSTFLARQERIWRVELAGMADYFERLKSSGSYRRHILQNFSKIEGDVGALWTAPTRGFLLHQIHAPLWRIVWADQDFAESMRTHEIELRLAKSAQRNNWNQVREEAAAFGNTNEGPVAFTAFDPPVQESSLSLYDRWRFLFSNTPSAFRGSHILRAFQAETEARLAVIAIALHRWRLRNASYPEQLTDLVPKYLSSVPIDPMDGGHLKYRREAQHRFLLYSVGPDGKDDGAQASTDKKIRTIWDGDDAIWPRRASP